MLCTVQHTVRERDWIIASFHRPKVLEAAKDGGREWVVSNVSKIFPKLSNFKFSCEQKCQILFAVLKNRKIEQGIFYYLKKERGKWAEKHFRDLSATCLSVISNAKPPHRLRSNPSVGTLLTSCNMTDANRSTDDDGVCVVTLLSTWLMDFLLWCDFDWRFFLFVE